MLPPRHAVPRHRRDLLVRAALEDLPRRAARTRGAGASSIIGPWSCTSHNGMVRQLRISPNSPGHITGAYRFGIVAVSSIHMALGRPRLDKYSKPRRNRSGRAGSVAGRVGRAWPKQQKAEVKTTPIQKAPLISCALPLVPTAPPSTRGACLMTTDRAPRRARSMCARGKRLFNGVTQTRHQNTTTRRG